MNNELTEEEIPAPIGSFILANAKGMQLFDGRYYHYSEVCALLKLFGERVLAKAAENARTRTCNNGWEGSEDYEVVDKETITDPKNLEV